MQRGTNLGRLGGYNQAVVLESIRRSETGISRVELAESTGLSPQTISNVARRLLDDGWIREGGTVISGPGKPRTMLELIPDRLVSVGIHLDPSLLTYVIVDLRGRIVLRRRVPLPASRTPEDTVQAIAAEVEKLIEESGYPRANVVGVGVASPGPVDLERGAVIAPPLLTGWGAVELTGPLRAALDLEVVLAKDTVAAATAEVWVGEGRDIRSFVCLYVGTGIGAGLVQDAQVWPGQTGNAGEIGHLLTASAPQDPCAVCGRPDCLAAELNFDAVLRKAAALGVDGVDFPGESASLTERITAASEVMEQAKAAEGPARELAKELTDLVATAVGQIASLMDLDQVVVCGPVWEIIRGFSEESVADVVNENFHGSLDRPVRVASSSLGGWISAIGGACVVFDDLLAPKASGLLLR